MLNDGHDRDIPPSGSLDKRSKIAKLPQQTSSHPVPETGVCRSADGATMTAHRTPRTPEILDHTIADLGGRSELSGDDSVWTISSVDEPRIPAFGMEVQGLDLPIGTTMECAGGNQTRGTPDSAPEQQHLKTSRKFRRWIDAYRSAQNALGTGFIGLIPIARRRRPAS
jgi:hypothetical protein